MYTVSYFLHIWNSKAIKEVNIWMENCWKHMVRNNSQWGFGMQNRSGYYMAKKMFSLDTSDLYSAHSWDIADWEKKVVDLH